MFETGIAKFLYEEKPIRVVLIDTIPWFVARDVCDALDIKDVSRAVNGNTSRKSDDPFEEGLDEDEKGTYSIRTPGGPQQMLCVNEAGVYSLVFKSRKPKAKTFKRWIAHEVLPSIRQTGSYTLPQAPQPQLPSSFLEALEMLVVQVKETIRLEGVVDELAPKAEGYDVFLDGQNAKPIGEVAKVVGWGRNRMFAWLREKHILMASNVPYQEHIEAGYFRIREVPKSHGESVVNHVQTLVTPKGMHWLLVKLKADEIFVH